MKTKSKALLLTLCAVLLVAASVLGTMAYLTSTDTVTNTFTIGQFDAKFILKYEGALAAKADTTAMFQTVTIPTGIDNVNTDSFKEVKVVAQAIQADGFNTWEDAFAAYDAK